MFNKGTAFGSKVLIPFGGQIPPTSIVGDKLAAKKAQKKPKKNITSETIKRITPYLIPNWTIFVWWPSKVLSRTISRHQRNMQKIIEKKPKKVTGKPNEYPWKYITLPVVNVKAENEESRGTMLKSTKWKACLCVNFEIWENIKKIKKEKYVLVA